ncbi:hypothetical protein ABZU53_12840 [Micromonospora sp. NPDC005194]|uniref:hypothetical protein n=1 Tax=Micromonospora sp. NPDC005194 TaxID=3156870 RepID=UPI0033A7AF2C
MNLATLTACATCRLALTERPDGDSIVYRHPVTEGRHDVAPVDAGQLSRVFNRCHTCTGAPPVWNYRTGLIQIGALAAGAVETYNDQWHVCCRCAQFIEADDSDGLTAHCAALMRWLPHSDEYTILRTLHRGIIIGRDGSRTLLTTTDWPPARITAEMLPKIRDRFTRLLRGPANLPEPLNDLGQRRTLANHLDLAPLYWINQEFTDLVNAVTDDQPSATVTDDIASAPAGLITWPEPVGRSRQLAAASWTPHADGWHLVGYRSVGSALDDDLMPTLRHEIGWLVPIHTQYVARGTTLDGRHPLGPLITTWLLINQQMAEAVPARLPKGTTRAYERSQRPAPEVRIVRIKPQGADPRPERTEPGSPRSRATPDHRFWVSGHERQQAYGPGRSLRRPVDIQPFLKGDEDLPIKLSTTVRVLGSRGTGKNPNTDNR